MARKSDPEPLIRAGLVLLLLCALGIGGLAHFTEVLMVLVIGILILAVAAGIVFFTWKSHLRDTTKWAISLAVGGLLVLGYWRLIQPPAEWPAADVTVTSVKGPPVSVRLTCAFTLGRQGYTASALRTYPTIAAAQADLPNLRNHKTTIFCNPANPSEIDTGFRPGWKGATGTIVDAVLLPPAETPTEVTGMIHEGLVPTPVQLRLAPHIATPSVGQNLRIYTNPENRAQLSLAPQMTAGRPKEIRFLVFAVLALLGAVILGIFSWRHRHDQPALVSSQPMPASPPVGPSVAILRAIDWYQFEQLIARLLALEGYQVTRQGGAKADGGVDLVAERDGVKTVVQCKHWQNWRVKEATIREMIGALKLHGGDRLSLYTLNPSTGPADQLARNQGIEIVTEDEIFARLRAVGLDRFADLLDPDNKRCPICDGSMKLRTGGFKPFWGCTRYPNCRGKIEAS